MWAQMDNKTRIHDQKITGINRKWRMKEQITTETGNTEESKTITILFTAITADMQSKH